MNGASILERLGGRRNVLLLQGPVGPFFDHLARFLIDQGRKVTKVNLNAGDAWFYRQSGAIDFTESPDHWPQFVDRVFVEHKIEAVLLFGDCRAYHRAAILRARSKSIPVFVFEEGYIRPHYVTFEPGGVNANSRLPLRPAALGLVPVVSRKRKVRPTFFRMTRYAMTYYLAGRLGRSRYPNYRHHKPFEIFPEAWYWFRSGLRKLLYMVADRPYASLLTGPLKGQFFLVPLQVFNDSQIRAHSDFGSVRVMIAMVLESFAREAPPDAHLVFKHHPMDRGHRHYGKQIAESAAELGVGCRVHYVHDLHLPTVLESARGVVLVNSTTGLSALFHGAPVKTLGRCLYDMPGLTHQGSLASFWRSPTPPDPELFARFRSYLVAMTQVNGSFYSGEPVTDYDNRLARVLVEATGEEAGTRGLEVRPRPAADLQVVISRPPATPVPEVESISA